MYALPYVRVFKATRIECINVGPPPTTTTRLKKNSTAMVKSFWGANRHLILVPRESQRKRSSEHLPVFCSMSVNARHPVLGSSFGHNAGKASTTCSFSHTHPKSDQHGAASVPYFLARATAIALLLIGHSQGNRGAQFVLQIHYSCLSLFVRGSEHFYKKPSKILAYVLNYYCSYELH